MQDHEQQTQPNFRTEAWRGQQIEEFKTAFEDTLDKIHAVLNSGSKKNSDINEWYDPNIENAYFVHGETKIEGKMPEYSLTWNPLTKVLDRYNIMVSQQGQGFGPKITELTEELARKLGAKRFVLSAITNEDWKNSLIKNGFIQDPLRVGTVYKEL